MKTNRYSLLSLGLFLLLPVFIAQTNAQTLTDNSALDRKVKQYLADHAGDWQDMNVPQSDGELLFDLIIKGGYTRALEIGTSTGYSGIYIAWALSKTGGKLITIDIDERRHKEAVAHFKAAGLAEYVDARLADAHKLVKELPGPFDFVFSDADKNWYKNYFVDLDPKLEVDGCYTSHNISVNRRGGGWNQVYYEYIMGLDHYESKLQPGSSLLVSYKIAEK